VPGPAMGCATGSNAGLATSSHAMAPRPTEDHRARQPGA
jgi:hypothetical protein